MVDSIRVLSKYAKSPVSTENKAHFLRYAEFFMELTDSMDKRGGPKNDSPNLGHKHPTNR